MTTRIFHTAMSLLAILTLLALPATSQGAYFEDFDTGSAYVAGPLDGQNGWVNVFGNGMDINLTGGKTGAGAFDDEEISNGSGVSHGVSFVNGLTYTISGDVKPTQGTFASIGIRSPGTTRYMIAQIYWDNFRGDTGFQMEVQGQIGLEVVVEDLTLPVSEQWYHLELEWTVGGDVDLTVLDDTNATAFTGTIDTSTLFNDTSVLTNFDVFNLANDGGSGAYDNLSVSDGVPEPSSIVLSAMGLLVLAGSARRRKWPGGGIDC